MDELVKSVEAWVREKDSDITKSSEQFLKASEEVSEVTAALARDSKSDLRDGIGDVMVTLTILAMQNNMDLYECLSQVYSKIKGHKGKNVNGVFVKENDLSS